MRCWWKNEQPLWEKGLAPGHLAQDHKKQMEKGNDLPQKMKGKELHAHVRALLARMDDEDDKEEFFADAEKQGFWLEIWIDVSFSFAGHLFCIYHHDKFK